ncbi:DUF2884 family protein [Dyella mobilis]|uniref:DUF2884 family protein n=1 Tax=Dyella mobilis TaxID=1849582 RepID=A0ABS2KN78_9GAMM|nr:DUF2884 family protein [Dyella mobilis]MBM7132424.1 DUF2884 family protein [Dyella mobilis]GLQ95588.1 hypothetical protein GCM10007863_00060 [Dyella mobilis]
MRLHRLLAAAALAVACAGLHAQDLSTVCHATSSYDLTVRPDQLIFDRAAPAPTRVVLGNGVLITDGQQVALNDEEQDRLALFQQDLRALMPRVKAVAQRGVDVTMQAVREESGSLNLDPDTRAELDNRLATDAADLHQRIAASQSTHDWRGDAANQYANRVIGDVAPLLASALGQQAVNAALSGDLQQAAELRDRASNLASGFQPRLQRRLQVLRPQIQALCPDIQRLSELQQGIRGSNGRWLNLLQIGQ